MIRYDFNVFIIDSKKLIIENEKFLLDVVK